MRLNKYIAQAGVASRRKADELTSNGNVKINGIVMRELGYDVLPDDRVEVNGREIKIVTKMIYIMLNKPKGYLTTVSDERDRPTVMDLITDIDERLFPVGRLDNNTSGMLILTNDGDLSHHLSHPKHEIYKTYKARVNGIMSEDKAAKLRKGVDIGGFITSKANVKIIKQAERSTILEIQIFEGKNRQVRKMCASVGNKVIDLERTAIGDLELRHLKLGHYRKLSKEEVEYLKNC